MRDIEIEPPSAEQKARANMEEMIVLAGSGADPVRIVSKLMVKGFPREEAERILPEILAATRGKRLRKKIITKGFGAVLAIGGLGVGIYLLTRGVLAVLPFFVGGAGIALLSGYLDNLWGFFTD